VKDETILILANAEWDWETRVNCHHIAARLAAENQVLFVDTVGGRTPAPRDWRKITRRLRRIAGGVRHIDDHLTVMAPFVIPLYRSELVRRLNSALLVWQIRRAMPSRARPILWVYLPSLVGMVGKLNEKLVVYHCVDDHSANPNVPSRQVAERELQLLNKADVVLTSSATLYAAKRGSNANTFYLPNVGDADHFASACEQALPTPEDLKDIPHPIAGFVGNITGYKVDFELLRQVASMRPDWAFVLIGPVGTGDPSTDVSPLKLANVHLLGVRPYSELPRYVQAFDVCTIPFRQNQSTWGTLPMKFFEYLAAGKPVVATDLPTLAEFRQFFYPVHDAREFSAALTASLTEDGDCASKRIRLARKYSWDERMREIDSIVSAALVRKGRG
jgi:glycosyltransferase involved in cell wall biosynthesis